jgi:hypothetical protein
MNRRHVRSHSRSSAITTAERRCVPHRYWQDRRRATEERYALDVAQQLADQEREAAARRERALIALAVLGLMASQTAAMAAPLPARPGYVYQVPAPAPSKADLPTLETCTYRLNALRGAMLCVDSRGNVHAR